MAGIKSEIKKLGSRKISIFIMFYGYHIFEGYFENLGGKTDIAASREA